MIIQIFEKYSVAVLVLCMLTVSVFAQKVDKEKLDTGIKRAAKAAKVLIDVAAMPPGESIPKELLAKAQVISVFPDATKVNMLVAKMMKGYGLSVRRTADGWGTPVFSGFTVSDKGWSKTKSGSPGIIFLFMGDVALKAFEKDHVVIAGAVEGPVGETLSEAVQKRINGETIFVYALADGKLAGISVADDDSAMSGLGMDNNVNKAVFGLKGNEVFWNKTPIPSTVTVPAEIADFQKALAALVGGNK